MVSPWQTGPPLVAVTGQSEQDAGAAYVRVAVQPGSAENVAVTVHVAPSDVNPFNAYASGPVKGALKVCELPPQELVTVSVPVDGAFTKEMEPLTE